MLEHIIWKVGGLAGIMRDNLLTKFDLKYNHCVLITVYLPYNRAAINFAHSPLHNLRSRKLRSGEHATFIAVQ